MTQVERYNQPLPDELPADVKSDWTCIGRLVRVVASSKMCPPAWKEDPEAIFSAFWQAHTLGLAVSVGVLRKFHNLDGVEPSAQTRLGLMHMHGHRTRWGRHDDELAELYVRKAGESEEERFAFTIEQAKAAHRLDEWVERWIDTEESWPNGKRKRRLEKYVLGSTTDEYKPDWVQPLIDSGQLKRLESWFAYREDMLMCRAASRACKFSVPEVEFGIEAAQHYPPPPDVHVDRPEVVAGVPARELEGSPSEPEDEDPGRPFA